MKRFSAAILSILSLLMSAQVLAGDTRTICRSDGVRHIIQVVHPYGWELPCEVHFTTPLESRVVWRADTDAGFCERKAQEIVERRNRQNWNCREEKIINSPALTDSSLFNDLPPPR